MFDLVRNTPLKATFSSHKVKVKRNTHTHTRTQKKWLFTLKRPLLMCFKWERFVQSSIQLPVTCELHIQSLINMLNMFNVYNNNTKIL